MTEKKKKNLQTDGYANQQNGIKQLDEYKNLVNQKTSALSSANQANKQALKYADNAALAQGYATQGAAMQNMTNLQNAYQNQVGGINQQYQQQLGALKNTASENAFTNYETELANSISQGTFNDQRLKELQDAYFGQMDSTRLGQAQRYTQDALAQINTTTDEVTGNAVFTNENGVKYSTNINDKNGRYLKDATFTVGTKKFKVELGSKVKDINLDPSTLEVGQIKKYKDGVFITKDSDGNVRYVLPRGTTRFKDIEDALSSK